MLWEGIITRQGMVSNIDMSPRQFATDLQTCYLIFFVIYILIMGDALFCIEDDGLLAM